MPAATRLLPLLLVLPALVSGAAAEPPASEADLAGLSWLAGSWSGKQGGVTMEEHWTVPRGGMMLGLHRDVGESGKAFFEYLRIESTPDGIFYLASPAGRSPATPFRLVTLEGRHVVFENPEHDFPKRIIYWMEESADVLYARVEGDDGKSQEWSWRRAR